MFNACQVDGWEALAQARRNTPERIAEAEAFFARIGAMVRHGGDQAFHRPADDSITLPTLEQFSRSVT